MNTCNLCSGITHRSSAKPWDIPLLESANFIVLSSLGALVEGWLLLIPKSHILCFGELPSSLLPEFTDLKKAVTEILQERFGEICIFEHGPSKPSSPTGCSVDHAHIHLVPLNFDLISAAQPFLPAGTQWFSAEFLDCQAAFSNEQDYLYVEQPIGSGFMTTANEFGSQTLRRVIAQRLGMPEKYNWREHPHTDIILSTLGKIQAFTGELSLCLSQAETTA